LERALRIIRHLQREREAAFGDLQALLAPVSPTTLSGLLRELIRLGEIERIGRAYRPAHGVLSAGDINFYELPASVRKNTQAILARTATSADHACALFARVGAMTMKIVDQHNLAGAHRTFSPVGYEWPLVPFHGFARVLLAYSGKDIAKACYDRWASHLRPGLVAPSWAAFEKQLASVREQGFALEYQEEDRLLMRLAVPVPVQGWKGVFFAVGLTARNIHLIDWERCLPIVRQAAADLGVVLASNQVLRPSDTTSARRP
jgi:DNA-binding IclR family transcriptional regulator